MTNFKSILILTLIALSACEPAVNVSIDAPVEEPAKGARIAPEPIDETKDEPGTPDAPIVPVVDYTKRENHQYELAGYAWVKSGGGPEKIRGDFAGLNATFGINLDDQGYGQIVWTQTATQGLNVCTNTLVLDVDAFQVVREEFIPEGTCSARYYFYEGLTFLFRTVSSTMHEYQGDTRNVDLSTRVFSGNTYKVLRLTFANGDYLEMAYKNR